jgi:hypothetical protein
MSLRLKAIYKDGAFVPISNGEKLNVLENAEVEIIVHDPHGLVVGHEHASAGNGNEFENLPFFGMWADRDEMSDSVAWVRKERDKWQQRLTQQR